MCFSVNMQCVNHLFQVSKLNLGNQSCCLSRSYFCTVPIFRQGVQLHDTNGNSKLQYKSFFLNFQCEVIRMRTVYLFKQFPEGSGMTGRILLNCSRRSLPLVLVTRNCRPAGVAAMFVTIPHIDSINWLSSAH